MGVFGLQDLIVAALAVHAITIVATLALARRPGSCRWVAFGGSVLASGLAIAVAARILVSGETVVGVLFAHAASGIVLDYAVTPLSAWFLMVLGLVSIPIAVYSVGYLAHAVPPSRTAAVGAMFNALLATVEVVFIVNNVIGFLFAWELMTLATAALVATEHEAQTSRRAAFLYLVTSHVGTGPSSRDSLPSHRPPARCHSQTSSPATWCRVRCAMDCSFCSCWASA